MYTRRLWLDCTDLYAGSHNVCLCYVSIHSPDLSARFDTSYTITATAYIVQTCSLDTWSDRMGVLCVLMGVRIRTFSSYFFFNPLYTGSPKRGILANSEDPDEMQHNAAFHQGLLR